MTKRSNFPYLFLCDPTFVYSGRQMYCINSSKFRRFCMYLSNCKRFKDIYDMNLRRDLMYDLALKHALIDYFSEYPEDEKRCIDNIFYMCF